MGQGTQCGTGRLDNLRGLRHTRVVPSCLVLVLGWLRQKQPLDPLGQGKRQGWVGSFVNERHVPSSPLLSENPEDRSLQPERV